MQIHAQAVEPLIEEVFSFTQKFIPSFHMWLHFSLLCIRGAVLLTCIRAATCELSAEVGFLGFTPTVAAPH